MHSLVRRYRRILLIAGLLLGSGYLSAQTILDEEEEFESPLTDSAVVVIEKAVADDEEDHTDNISFYLFQRREVFQHRKDSLQVRRWPENQKQKIKEDPAYWYSNYEPEKDEPEETDEIKSPTLPNEKILKIIAWILIIGGFIFLVIWFLMNNGVSLFTRTRSFVTNTEDVFEEEEDIFSIDYGKQISKAVEDKNYRLAIRYHFLRLLKTWSQKQIIPYTPEKTNLDYLFHLQGTAFYNDFFAAARHYEYNWYGKFELNAEKYELIRQEFEAYERKGGRI